MDQLLKLKKENKKQEAKEKRKRRNAMREGDSSLQAMVDATRPPGGTRNGWTLHRRPKKKY